ncbi:MAG: inositol monophosphatase [Phycisphaerae bacterium]|nr:inositol monophosphatase [Phycisphaerae bacterium]
MSFDLSSDLQLAISLARGAGQIVRAKFGRVDRLTKTHAATTDEAVTEADRESQAFIVRGLREARPNDGIIGEESETGESITFEIEDIAGRAWVIDPIDGTNNFIAGYGAFAVCIGLMDKGEAVAGVVLDVTRDEMYAAARGYGAWRIERVLGIATTKDVAGGKNAGVPASGFADEIERCDVAGGKNTGVPSGQPLNGVDPSVPAIRFDEKSPGVKRLRVSNDPMSDASLLMLTSNLLDKYDRCPAWAVRWIGQTNWKVRILGSAAMEAVQVAAGVAMGAVTVNGKIWDAVAPSAIVLEAGGIVTDLSGKPLFPFDLNGYIGQKVPFLAAGPRAHGELLREILSNP